MTATLDGRPHVRFDEMECVSAKPRRGTLLYANLFFWRSKSYAQDEEQRIIMGRPRLGILFEFIIVFLLLAQQKGAASTSAQVTGVAIAPQYVMTAYHVVRDCKNISVRFGDGEQPWMNAVYEVGDEAEDWCVLRLQGMAPSSIVVELEESAVQGDKVYTFGYPRLEVDGEMEFSEGSINALPDYEGSAFILHSVPVMQGNVGGALFLFDNEKAVGLIIGGEKNKFAQNGKLAISFRSLKQKIGKYIPEPSNDQVKRRDNRKATCIVKGDVIRGTSYNNAQHTGSGRNDTNTKTYQIAKDKIAIIEGKQGTGTGFLCAMEGGVYLVTNRHVADQRGKITALFQDGTKITFSGESIMDMAVNRDLVRFKIDTPKTVLSLADDVPDIGENVEFYGNAGGKGVITVTTGKVLAVGQERIEIDSQIQSGNSGSPLIRVSDGKVLGVTSLSTFNRIDNDPSKVGTRYDPNVKLTREFAVRFTGVEWQQMSYGRFLKWVNAREDLIDFVGTLMEKVCFGDMELIFESDLPDKKYTGLTALNDQLRKIAACDEQLKKARDKYYEMVLHNQKLKPGSIGYKSEAMFDLAIKNITDRTVASYKVRPMVIENVSKMVKSTNLLTEDEKRIFIKYLDAQLRDYNQRYYYQLKGLKLPNIPQNPKKRLRW